MKRFALFVIALAILGISAGCGGNKPRDADFYTFTSSADYGDSVLWLGMTKDQVPSGVLNISSLEAYVRLRYQNGVLRSMTAVNHGFSSNLGLVVTATTADQAEAILRAVPNAAVSWDGSTLTAEKTVNGVLYTMRILFFSDHTIKAINVCTDPALDDLNL